jgi:hypothetical protein
MADELRWRDVLTEGTFESIGNATTGLAMTGLLLIIWALVRRRVESALGAKEAHRVSH